MELYWCPKTRSARVIWMLEELGVDYDKTLIDIRDEEARKHPGFLEASPMGKVPALRDGDVLLADGPAISLYLADRYASGTLAPAVDDPARGRFLYWMFFGPGVMEPCMAEKFGTAQPNRAAHGWGDYDTMVAALEAGLAGNGPWLMGEQFTAADVVVGSTAAFLYLFGIGPESQPITDYVARCKARPAYERAFADFTTG